MNLNIIEANKNVFVYTAFAGGNAIFNNRFDLPFIPDYVIVRGVNYATHVDAPGMGVIWSDLVSDFIGTLTVHSNTATDVRGNYETPILYFKLGRPINGTYGFKIYDNATGTAVSTLTGQLAIHLEFIKLKAERPQIVR